MGHEILHDQAAEVFGRFRQGHLKYVPKKLTAAVPGDSTIVELWR
ncbi:hypothetical protein PCURB6_22380 [Paenibacillus curdlanolyticus]|nr:hypothetical protein PCURB6_22380 [Paenibacillus curdlanolyticus]